MASNVGAGLFLFGAGLVAAATIRAIVDLLQADAFDPWTIVLSIGFILMSIGLGLKKRK